MEQGVIGDNKNEQLLIFKILMNDLKIDDYSLMPPCVHLIIFFLH
jgi:hypothetical protein